MPSQQPTDPITAADFGDDWDDFEPELRQQALEIAKQLREERPEEDRARIVRLALQRARAWWIDQAG